MRGTEHERSDRARSFGERRRLLAKEEASRRQGGEEAAVGTSEREGCIRLDRRLSLSNLIIILDYRGPFALVTRHRITRS